MRRCRHQWEEQGRVFNPGAQDFKVRWADPQTLDRLTYGFTSVTLRCSMCGRLDVQTFTGKVA